MQLHQNSQVHAFLRWKGSNHIRARGPGLEPLQTTPLCTSLFWTIYLVLTHTFSRKPGQPPLFALCGVLDCEWCIEGSAGRNVLLSNVVVVCVYNQSVFWLYRFSSGCMRGTTFCSYLLVSLFLFSYFFCLSLLWLCMVNGEFVYLFIGWVCSSGLTQSNHTNSQTCRIKHTSFNSSYIPFTPGINMVGQIWSQMVCTIYRFKQDLSISKNILKTRSIYLRSKSM